MKLSVPTPFVMKLILLVLLVCLECAHVSPEPQFVSSFCIEERGLYSANSMYDNNLSLVFFNLTTSASSRGFYNSTVGEGSDKVYGLFYCRGDLKSQDCHDCVQTAKLRIKQECSNNKEAIIFYNKCTLRYANRSIFSMEEETPNDWSYSQTMVSNKEQFNKELTAAMDGPINQAAFNASLGGFAVGQTDLGANQTLYCLVQCTPDILGSPCHRCLVAALYDNLIDEGKTRMSLFMPSCQVMYSLNAPFFNAGNMNIPASTPFSPSPNLPPPSQARSASHGKRKLQVVFGVVAALAFILFLSAIWFFLCRRKSSKEFKDPPPEWLQNMKATPEEISLTELALATDNFSSANLLGQGGYGNVYKGRLRNSREVAVKQLKAGSNQGEREFKAEVETISRVHHRHLLLLVGYCISGHSRMLVYEYVPNKTLHFHLHGRMTISWENRLKIALGTAKGLAYLHEECQPKIIHRDIKATNILLDNDFEAKVADFGLAKFSSDTETHVSTRVVGTFGYLAPEYAVSGKLTEKSYVFSFGVVLLELITGRRPFDMDEPFMEEGFVQWAKPLLTEALENRNFKSLADPKLDKYDASEMAQMVACAVACLSSSPRERPKMSQVVRALAGNLSAEALQTEIASASDNRTFHGSTDYDSGTQSQYNQDLNKLKKLDFECLADYSTESSTIFTNEQGVTQSTSSTENQHT